MTTPSPSSLLNTICKTTNQILPPTRRTAIFNTLCTFHCHHPFLFTFLLAQVICSGIPIVLFFVFASGVFLLSVVSALIVAALVTGLWAAVALLVLVPVVVGTVVFGAVVWAWAWAGWLSWRMTRGYLGWEEERVVKTRIGSEEDEVEKKEVEIKGERESSGDPCEGQEDRMAGDELEI